MAYIYLFGSLGYYQSSINSLLPVIWITSLVATLVEALPMYENLDDNLTVPLISAIVGQLLYMLQGAAA